jgi:hypothetical protein
MRYPPRDKRTPTKRTKKNWQHFEHLRTWAFHKAGFGASRLCVKRGVIRMGIIMAAVEFW